MGETTFVKVCEEMGKKHFVVTAIRSSFPLNNLIHHSLSGGHVLSDVLGNCVAPEYHH